MTEGAPEREPRTPYRAERVGAFIDAVVAIAMTLLILPLMESVTEVARDGDDTATWLGDHEQQLVSFVVSFVIIALFWMIHHRLFARVRGVTSALLWLTVAWMLTIVWLPVATAISGVMEADDALARWLYIGSMIATCLCSLAIRLYLRAHPSLHEHPAASLRAGIAADIATSVLFGVALAVALLAPGIGYYALLVMLLSPLAQALVVRMLGGR